MHDDFHLSDEESEQKFEEDLERWENEPSYMQADDIEYLKKPTDAGAKVLWLKYTRLGRPIPDYVTERITKLFEKEYYKRPNCKLLPESRREPVFYLIHLALSGREEDLQDFWDLLFESGNTSLSHSLKKCFFGQNLLDEARRAFPEEKNLADTDLFRFAAKILGLYERSYETPQVELARGRYQTFREKIEKSSIT